MKFDEAMRVQRQSKSEVQVYKVVRHIGAGGQGSCTLLRRFGDDKLVVRKTIKASHVKMSRGVALEVRILRDQLPTHRRICNLFSSFTYPSHTELFLEHCDGGDLDGVIEKYSAHQTLIPESFLWHCFIQLSEALAFLHYGFTMENGTDSNARVPPRWERVIHRDIKPANVFLKFRSHHHFQSNYPDLKLGDFGLAAVTTDWSHTSDCPWGSYAWQPPELPEATAKGDVWAVGAIIHALAHEGDPPVAEPPPGARLLGMDPHRWYRDPAARQPRSLHDYSGSLDRWMMECFRRNPTERVSALELVSEMAPEGRRKMARQWWPLRRWAFEEPVDWEPTRR